MTVSNDVQMLTCRTIDSPVGPLTLAGVGDTLTRVVLTGQVREPDRGGWYVDDNAFPGAVAQLAAYFDGTLSEFDIELGFAGTEFQRKVWTAVQAIPFGQTRSYASIAEQIGSPAASRAVGSAVGRNPVPIVVPCHRVIGSAGSLTGYLGGTDCKNALLGHESRLSDCAPAPLLRAQSQANGR